MNIQVVNGLILNIALLLSVSIIYNSFLSKVRSRNWFYEVLLGAITGVIGILLMMNSVRLNTGVIFDTRSILISVSGLFFGFIPTAVAALTITAYRIFIGGPGVLTGVTVTLLTAVCGLLWRRLRKESGIQTKKRNWREFYAFGLITHAVMLFSMLTLPENVLIETIRQIGLPILVVYPAGSLLLCMVMAAGIKNIKIKQALEISELRFRTMFEQAPIGITVADGHKTIFINPAFERITGRSKEELKDIDWANITHQDDVRADISKFEELQAGLISEYSMVKRYVRPDGSAVWVDMIIASIKNGNAFEGSHICMIQDIGERRQKEEEILYLNYHDILTGLYNRTYFDEEVRRTNKQEMMPLSFIIGDIDGLKIINDAFGHEHGDMLLKQAAGILQAACRPGDTVARTGGDEFCILLPKTDNAAVRDVFNTIKSAFDEHTQSAGRENYFTSVSLGYSTKTTADEPFGVMYKEAEENMYRRKMLEHRSLHSSLLTSIKSTMEEKSYETQEHAQRLAYLSISLGKEIGLGDKDLIALELFSTLHDVGKISIDKNILTKPGPLNAYEWTEIKKHPIAGFRIAHAVPELRHIAEYILCHHERWDGQGYPHGRTGEDIPLLSRILAVADAYDSMTQDRAYRKAMPEDAATAELLRGAGTQFDAAIVNVFINKVLGAGRAFDSPTV